ncbi:MAG: hypothetical protein CMP00_04870 [Woeseiaceae bacterium]|mgnify:FL=1|nr:hypothetical protein [Woeseiaceae bacterium]|tara:strand:+ start:311 stop:523 length:213 start_codon:yes stop_codon:yes gene_type:complete
MNNYEDPARTSPPEDGNIYINLMMESFSDYERGEYDCVHGHEAEDGESDKYYQGYAQQYAVEQNQGAKSD